MNNPVEQQNKNEIENNAPNKPTINSSSNRDQTKNEEEENINVGSSSGNKKAIPLGSSSPHLKEESFIDLQSLENHLKNKAKKISEAESNPNMTEKQIDEMVSKVVKAITQSMNPKAEQIKPIQPHYTYQEDKDQNQFNQKNLDINTNKNNKGKPLKNPEKKDQQHDKKKSSVESHAKISADPSELISSKEILQKEKTYEEKKENQKSAEEKDVFGQTGKKSKKKENIDKGPFSKKKKQKIKEDSLSESFEEFVKPKENIKKKESPKKETETYRSKQSETTAANREKKGNPPKQTNTSNANKGKMTTRSASQRVHKLNMVDRSKSQPNKPVGAHQTKHIGWIDFNDPLFRAENLQGKLTGPNKRIILKFKNGNKVRYWWEDGFEIASSHFNEIKDKISEVPFISTTKCHPDTLNLKEIYRKDRIYMKYKQAIIKTKLSDEGDQCLWFSINKILQHLDLNCISKKDAVDVRKKFTTIKEQLKEWNLVLSSRQVLLKKDESHFSNITLKELCTMTLSTLFIVCYELVNESGLWHSNAVIDGVIIELADTVINYKNVQTSDFVNGYIIDVYFKQRIGVKNF